MSRLGLAAHTYASKGWHVVPLHSPQLGGTGCSCEQGPRCPAPGKHPRLRDWLHHATCDLHTVDRWWAKWPDANIGFQPGRSGFIVLDFDSPAAEDHGRRLGCFAEPALEVTTARGCHRYFQRPASPGTIEKLVPGPGFEPGFEAHADTSQVLLPPSVHPTGVVYTWRVRQTPALPLPPAVLKLVLERASRGPAPVAGHIGPIPAGQRNSTLNAIACAMRRKGCSDHSILLALQIENTERCRPPVGEDELEAIVRSSQRVLAKDAPGRAPLPGIWARG